MAFLSLWNWLKPLQRQSKIDRRRHRRPERTLPARIVPRLEVLEDRTVPSTLTVTNNLDTGVAGDGSLRGEIAAANSGDTIQFAPSLAGQTITLTKYELAITKSLDIEGLGANQLTISGNNQSRVFDITASNASVTLASLTISDGNNSYYGGGGINNVGTLTINNSTLSGNYDNSMGGAIDNAGTLTINNSTLSGNSTSGSFIGSGGGAIANTGTLTINNSTLSGNAAGWAWDAVDEGGAIYMAGGNLAINNSTISGNSARGAPSIPSRGTTSGGLPATSGLGGGLYVAAGTVTIDHSTIADNEAVGGNDQSIFGLPYGPGAGGGIYNAAGAGALQMYDTILADNTTSDYGPDLYGGVTSQGHNLIGNTTGGSGFAASDLVNVNPQLGTLQNYGGPTQTMPLLAGSPAINAGDNTNAPAYDQRGPGFPRIVGGIIDIGAYEVQSFDKLIVSGFPSRTTAGTAANFTVTAENAGGTIDTGYTGTVHFTSSDPHAILPANYTFTAADAGVHTFTATLKTAGTQSITATDTTTASVTSSDTGITVTPAAASKFVLVAPASVNPGVPFSLTVTVEDAYGNVVVGYSGTIHFSSTDNKAALPANYTFTATDKGVHTFTGLVLRKKGNQTITVTDTHNSSLTANAIVDVL